MAFIPIPGAAEAVVSCTLLGEPCVNVFGFTQASPSNFDAADLTLLAETVGQAWVDYMLPVMSNSMTLVEVKATDQSSASGPAVSWNPASPEVGTLTSPALPGQNTLVLTHRTGSRGRSFRGRTYLGGLVEEDVTGNDLSGGRTASLLAGFGDFLAACEAQNFVFSILSRYTNNAPRTTGLATTVISSTFRNTRIDSQRRRTRG